MAFAIPVILMFVWAMVDFGIALDRRIVLQHTVADSSRRGSVDPDIAQTIAYAEAQSQGLLDNATDPEGDAVVVCFTDDDGDGTYGEVGDSIVVKVDFLYRFTVPFGSLAGAFGVDVSPGITLNPSATKRLETTVSVAPADQCV